MIISINNFTLSPAISLIGTAKSFTGEKLIIKFSEEWKGLRKHVDFNIPDDKIGKISVPYRANGIKIPKEVFKNTSVCTFVVCGEKKNISLISKVGYISVLPSKNDIIPFKNNFGGENFGT